MSSTHGDDNGDRWPPGCAKQPSPLPPEPPGPADKAEILGRLARLVAAADPRQSLPERLAQACRHLLNVDGTAITLENTTLQRITLWSTSEDAARLEDLQEVTGEGPSHQAFTTGEPVTAQLNDDEQRWPEFADGARRAVGDVTIHALPIRPDHEVIGVLILLQLPATGASPLLAGAQFLADAIGAALLTGAPGEDDTARDGPWSSRAEVHQAIGMVIAELHISMADALAILRAHAFAHDTSVHDIAMQVLSRRLDFGSDSSESL